MTDAKTICHDLDLLGDWLDAKGYTEEAGLCTRAMDEINRLREARDECERQYQEQVNNIGEVLEERNILRAENAQLKQVSALTCDKCGWAMQFPGEECRNCGYEALRAENARLSEENDAWKMDGGSCANEVKRLRAENARLRRIRSEMNNLLYAIDCFPNDLGSQLTDAASAARAAMGETK